MVLAELTATVSHPFRAGVELVGLFTQARLAPTHIALIDTADADDDDAGGGSGGGHCCISECCYYVCFLQHCIPFLSFHLFHSLYR